MIDRFGFELTPIRRWTLYGCGALTSIGINWVDSWAAGTNAYESAPVGADILTLLMEDLIFYRPVVPYSPEMLGELPI